MSMVSCEDIIANTKEYNIKFLFIFFSRFTDQNNCNESMKLVNPIIIPFTTYGNLKERTAKAVKKIIKV